MDRIWLGREECAKPSEVRPGIRRDSTWKVNKEFTATRREADNSRLSPDSSSFSTIDTQHPTLPAFHEV